MLGAALTNPFNRLSRQEGYGSARRKTHFIPQPPPLFGGTEDTIIDTIVDHLSGVVPEDRAPLNHAEKPVAHGHNLDALRTECLTFPPPVQARHVVRNAWRTREIGTLSAAALPALTLERAGAMASREPLFM